MNWGRNLKLSVHALSRARLRTLLSSSSMAIGIAAVTLLFGVASGADKAFSQALELMGKNLISVGSQRKESSALRGSSKRFQTLTLADWQAISTELASVERAAPVVLSSSSIRYGGEVVRMTIIGTTPEFQITNQFSLLAGRFIDEMDVTGSARVAVVGSEVAKQLFAGEQPLGERLLVDSVPFIIVGLLEGKGLDATGSPQDDRILIPVTTAVRRVLNVDYVDRIFVQATSKDAIETAMIDVQALLRDRHSLDVTSDDDFTLRNQTAVLKTLKQTDQTLSRFLAATSILTLALASVGLLAVSLLSVAERQAEIGLRLALGALPGRILTQFLTEAMMIALLGALAGLLAGATGIMVGQWLMGWQLAMTLESFTITFMISLGLSLLAGGYPAMRAARMNPIVALRGS